MLRYVKKLGDLKALGDPIEKRFQEDEARPNAIDALNKTVTSFLADASSPDEKYAHIEQVPAAAAAMDVRRLVARDVHAAPLQLGHS